MTVNFDSTTRTLCFNLNALYLCSRFQNRRKSEWSLINNVAIFKVEINLNFFIMLNKIFEIIVLDNSTLVYYVYYNNSSSVGYQWNENVLLRSHFCTLYRIMRPSSARKKWNDEGWKPLRDVKTCWTITLNVCKSMHWLIVFQINITYW